MTDAPAQNSIGTAVPPTFSELIAAMKKEIEAQSGVRQRMYLTGGRLTGKMSPWSFYRFEYPEGYDLSFVFRCSISLGKVAKHSYEAWCVEHTPSTVTLALPFSAGPLIPELFMQWLLDPQIRFLDRMRAESDRHAERFDRFRDPGRFASQAPEERSLRLPENMMPVQRAALENIFRNRVTICAGPRHSGRTTVGALAALIGMEKGLRILVVTATTGQAKKFAEQLMKFQEQLSAQVREKTTILGFPAFPGGDASDELYFEHQCETKRQEKKKLFRERVNLLEEYQNGIVKRFLHEDHTIRAQDLRAKKSKLKESLETLRAETKKLKTEYQEIQKTGFLERFKKNISKESLQEMETQLVRKTEELTTLTESYEALANDVLAYESHSPIPFEEQKAWRQLNERINELGGAESVRQAVDEFVAFDRGTALADKRIIISSIAAFMEEPLSAITEADLLVVEHADMLPLPILAALSLCAKENMLVTMDPFSMPAEPRVRPASVPLRVNYLSLLSGKEEMPAIMHWAEEQKNWVFLLKYQLSTSPPISLLLNTLLYDDSVQVFSPPEAKGSVRFIDTSALQAVSKQWLGKSRIIPANDIQMRLSVEVVRHALLEEGRSPSDIVLVVPFPGTTFHARLHLRQEGIRNVEVASIDSLRGIRKGLVVFDTVVAGTDFTVRQLDDRKIGEHAIARMINTLFASAEQDLVVLADMRHFSQMYSGRFFLKFMMILQSSSAAAPDLERTKKKVAQMDWLEYHEVLSGREPRKAASQGVPMDAELAVQMKMMEKNRPAEPVIQQHQFEWRSAVLRAIASREETSTLAQTVGTDRPFNESHSSLHAMETMVTSLPSGEREFRQLCERWYEILFATAEPLRIDLPYFRKDIGEARARVTIGMFIASFIPSGIFLVDENRQIAAATVAKFFKDTIGKQYPSTVKEWQQASLALVRHIETYTRWVSDQIRK